MSPKNFKTLAGVATALAIWSIVLAFQSDSVVITFARGRALIDDIDTARLTRIEVSKGDESVVLQRAGVNFRVESKDSYPADGGRINKIIGDCMQIALIREISDTEVSHEILGVDEGVDSTVVRFLDGDQEIVAVVIGNAEGAGNYVRLRGDPTVYLVRGASSSTPIRWTTSTRPSPRSIVSNRLRSAATVILTSSPRRTTASPSRGSPKTWLLWARPTSRSSTPVTT